MVGLIDEQVVTPGLLEGHPGVFRRGFLQFLQLGALAFERSLDHLFRERILRGAQLFFQGAKFTVLVVGPDVGVDVDALEYRLRDDHHVPVAGGRLGGQPAAVLGVGPGGADQEPRRRIPPFRFPGDLFDEVVGNHDPGLFDQAEAFELHRAHEHGAGFPGAHHMVEQHGRLGDDPGHGVALVVVRGEPRRQARQRQVRPVVDGGAEAVEAGVELGDQFLAAGLVLPHPFAEPVHQLAALGLGGDGGGAVDGRSAAQFDVGGRPVDHDRLRVQGALEQVDRVAVPGPPRLGHRDGVARPGGAVHRPFAVVVGDGDPPRLQHFAGELLNDFGSDPRRTQAGVDLAGHLVGRHDLPQRVDVVGVDRVGVGRGAGLGQFASDVARQGGDRRDELVGVAQRRVDQAAQLFAHGVLGVCEQGGDVGDIDTLMLVQAHRERVVDVLGPGDGDRIGEQIHRENRRLGGQTGLLIDPLQGLQGAPAGICPQRLHDVRLAFLRGGGLPRRGIPLGGQIGRDIGVVGVVLGAPGQCGGGDRGVMFGLGARFGLGHLEPIDRAVLGDVGVVEAVEVGAELLALRTGSSGALRAGDRFGGITQREQFQRLGHPGLENGDRFPAVALPRLQRLAVGIETQ